MSNEFKFVRAISIEDLPTEAWQYITGKPTELSDIHKYYKQVAWLFRGLNIRTNAISKIPFSIYKGSKEIDNSEDYQNKVGFLPRPQSIFAIIEASLTIFGYAYLFKARSAFKNKNLRYLLPTSITPDINLGNGEIKFERKEQNNKQVVYDTDDIVYFWSPDPFVEIGEPTTSPAIAAGMACGVLLNVDLFAELFFKQGAVKTTILTADSLVEQERERLKTWWKRVLGIDKAWRTEIIQAGKVEPVVIGEGLESLQDKELTMSKRVDIAAALGIPYSVLFSNASNRATAEQDDFHLYDKTIVPEAQFIEDVLNDQVFDPIGYRLNFKPQELDVFQESEAERSQSLTQMIAALQNPQEFIIASDILGYDIPDDTMRKIEALEPAEPIVEPTAEPIVETEPIVTERSLELEDLAKWERKAKNRLKQGRDPDCPFESKYIDPVKMVAISTQLAKAETPREIELIFENEWIGYP